MLHHMSTQKTKPSRVVLLGGSGFIGRKIAHQLEGYHVPVLSLSSKDIDLVHPSTVEKLASLLKENDSLVFLSALTPDKGRGIEAFEKNILMATHVLKSLEKQSISHLVYFSSDAVYAMNESSISEAMLPNPEDLYGLMHFTREKMMQMSFKNTVIVRPTLVYGAEDTHNSYGPNRFRRMAEEKGEITLFGEGEETRDHIYVSDLAHLIVHVLMHKSVGQLNAVTGRSISYGDLAHKVASLYGEGAVRVKVTERKNPVTHRHFDNTNVFKTFPEFRFTELEEGLNLVHQELRESVKI